MRVSLSLAMLAIVGCHRDDEPDDRFDIGDPMVLDEAIVRERFDDLDVLLPTCTLVEGARRQAVSGIGSSGSCGGTVDVTYDHGDGDTTYNVVFNDFCVSSDGSDATMDGRVVGFEDGTPSDDGPVVDTFSLDSDGPVTVDHDGGTLEFELTGLEVAYGDPQPWSPGTPTATSPDRITIEQLDAVAVGADEPALTLVDAHMQRVGAVPEITIDDGYLVVEGEGHLVLSTPPGDPLTLEDLLLGGGALSLEGADGVVLQLDMVPAQPFVFELSLDGQPMDLTFDCSPSAPLLLEVFPALTAALPLY